MLNKHGRYLFLQKSSSVTPAPGARSMFRYSAMDADGGRGSISGALRRQASSVGGSSTHQKSVLFRRLSSVMFRPMETSRGGAAPVHDLPREAVAPPPSVVQVVVFANNKEGEDELKGSARSRASSEGEGAVKPI